MPLGNPADGLDITKGARRTFHVGLKVVLGIAVFVMSLLLLFPFGNKVVAVGTDTIGIHLLAEPPAQLIRPRNRAGLKQIGQDGDVFAGGGLSSTDCGMS